LFSESAQWRKAVSVATVPGISIKSSTSTVAMGSPSENLLKMWNLMTMGRGEKWTPV
jgi:hypothetical protein